MTDFVKSALVNCIPALPNGTQSCSPPGLGTEGLFWNAVRIIHQVQEQGWNQSLPWQDPSCPQKTAGTFRLRPGWARPGKGRWFPVWPTEEGKEVQLKEAIEDRQQCAPRDPFQSHLQPLPASLGLGPPTPDAHGPIPLTLMPPGVGGHGTGGISWGRRWVGGCASVFSP